MNSATIPVPSATRLGALSCGIARITISIDPAALTVLTATPLEYRLARAELPHLNVIKAGIALAALASQSFPGITISCGLAGGLQDRSSTGTIVIPELIRRPDGRDVHCDPELVGLLRKGAQALGAAHIGEPLLTSDSLIRGDARRYWADRGFVAADMESGLIDAPRIAVIRVILDTVQHELNPAWLRPGTLIVHPRAWLELPWLAREAPRCARLAARVIRNAFETTSAH